jgi:hypothetical protein
MEGPGVARQRTTLRAAPAAAAALLAFGVTSCARDHPRRAVQRSALPHTAPSDSNDLDGDPRSGDDSAVLGFGHAADPREAQKIGTVVSGYYRVALADEGSRACSMLYRTTLESIPEQVVLPSRAGVESSSEEHTCRALMASLFSSHHRSIAAEQSTMKVTHIRIAAARALVVMSFATTPEPRTMQLGLEDGKWKIKQPLDSGMP